MSQQATAETVVDRILLCGVLCDTVHGCLPQHPAMVGAAIVKIAHALNTSNLVLLSPAEPEKYLRKWLAGDGKLVALVAQTGQFTYLDHEDPTGGMNYMADKHYLPLLRAMVTQYAFLSCVANRTI